ncbi:MAG: hypothetical protein CMN32_11120 [Saprospirales bacterium]|nr:hypothetical protein [Saprospirales bacterium]
MILYNVTVRVDADIAEEWLNWMKSTHIPDVMRTGYFVDYKVMKILQPAQEDDSITYAVQYFCEDQEKLEAYWQKEAPALQKEHTDKYSDKALAFRTVMEVIQ